MSDPSTPAPARDPSAESTLPAPETAVVEPAVIEPADILARLDQLALVLSRVDARLHQVELGVQPAEPGHADNDPVVTDELESDEPDNDEPANDEPANDEPAASMPAISQQLIDRLQYETDLLKERLDSLMGDNHELRQQNEDLAAQLAQSSIRQTVRSDAGIDESLSWEERKALIFRQMEEDSFDASSFIESLSETARQAGQSELSEEDSAEQGPVAFVEELSRRLQRSEQELQRRDEEIGELRLLLQQQSDTRQSGVVMGAAAIAGMVDSDELVCQERERLQELKAEWEAKFRQAEIAASLERAKLSRERQQLARKAAELEDQLVDLQRERRAGKEPESGGRRWLAELGLADKDD